MFPISFSWLREPSLFLDILSWFLRHFHLIKYMRIHIVILVLHIMNFVQMKSIYSVSFVEIYVKMNYSVCSCIHSFMLMYRFYFIQTYPIIFTHTSVYRSLVHFQFESILSSATMNILIQVSWSTKAKFL